MTVLLPKSKSTYEMFCFISDFLSEKNIAHMGFNREWFDSNRNPESLVPIKHYQDYLFGLMNEIAPSGTQFYEGEEGFGFFPALIDCRSEEGITIGLIDSLISISRVLAGRDFSHPATIEALKDLGSDDDFNLIVEKSEEVQ